MRDPISNRALFVGQQSVGANGDLLLRHALLAATTRRQEFARHKHSQRFDFQLNLDCTIGKTMTRAKTQSTPSSEKWEDVFLCALGVLAQSTLLKVVLLNI